VCVPLNNALVTHSQGEKGIVAHAAKSFEKKLVKKLLQCRRANFRKKFLAGYVGLFFFF